MYAWDWGDGATSSGPTSPHTYVTAGHYVVRLTVTDDAGASGTTSHPADPAAPVNRTPTAVAAGSCTWLSCSVNAAGSVDPDGTITGYSWNWGDGTRPAPARAPVTSTARRVHGRSPSQ